jgi:hypothetical protein
LGVQPRHRSGDLTHSSLRSTAPSSSVPPQRLQGRLLVIRRVATISRLEQVAKLLLCP